MRLRLRKILGITLLFGLISIMSGLLPATAQNQPGYRKLAPGILTTIAPDRQQNETFSMQDMVEMKVNEADLMNWTPKTISPSQLIRFDSSNTEFHRPVWYLEFSFKPMRMIKIDFPNASGKMTEKMIWYMVYRIRNTGKHLVPKQLENGAWEVTEVDEYKVKDAVEEIHCNPTFSLETIDKKKAYLDRLIPAAITAIREREDKNRKLLSSAEIAKTPIPLSTADKDNSVWGVATWEDIDPKIDRYSVYVGGLTNAYRFIDPPGAYKKGEKPAAGRLFQNKYLQLYFWRPSDEFTEQETDIYFGLPVKDEKTGVETIIDYKWIFR